VQQKRFDKVVICICILTMFLALISIVTRYLTRQILIERMGIDNAFTRIVWFDNDNARDTESVEVSINWEKLYPFTEAEKTSVDSNKKVSTIEKYQSIISGVEGSIDTYATDLLAFRNNIVEIAAGYEEAIGWDVVSYSEYNGIVAMSDGYLTEYVEKRDATNQYLALKEFNEYCIKNDYDFLFVTAPYKISEYDDTDISGTLDFSNQNANELNALLTSSSIDCLDIREIIKDNGLNNHELFYRTDHHWLTTTGMWGAQKILEYCNEQYEWNANSECLDLSNFRIEEYPNSFLGSQGKKVTLARTTPDDFELLYPQFETKLHYVVPARGVDAIGDYSVCYDMKKLGFNDYYQESSYHVCNYGDQAVNEIENLIFTEDKTIVIIHDSFGDTLISGLALGVKNVYALDIRHFTGSVRAYIEEKNPDLVIVMYNAGSLCNNVDYSTHKDEFDFR